MVGGTVCGTGNHAVLADDDMGRETETPRWWQAGRPPRLSKAGYHRAVCRSFCYRASLVSHGVHRRRARRALLQRGKGQHRPLVDRDPRRGRRPARRFQRLSKIGTGRTWWRRPPIGRSGTRPQPSIGQGPHRGRRVQVQLDDADWFRPPIGRAPIWSSTAPRWQAC